MSSGRALLAQANCQAGTGWHKTGSKSNTRWAGSTYTTRNRCRLTRCIFASASKDIASPQQQQQEQSQALSVVLLLNENIRRQTSRCAPVQQHHSKAMATATSGCNRDVWHESFNKQPGEAPVASRFCVSNRTPTRRGCLKILCIALAFE
jgi:hypothetical protein